jgi:hypothetical protein
MSNKVEILTNPVDLVLARKNTNINSSIEVDSTGTIVPRNSNGNKDGYTVIVRKSTNSGDIPIKAKNLRACKGLKGCEFAQCAKKAFGKLPRHLEGLCSTDLK